MRAQSYTDDQLEMFKQMVSVDRLFRVLVRSNILPILGVLVAGLEPIIGQVIFLLTNINLSSRNIMSKQF